MPVSFYATPQKCAEKCAELLPVVRSVLRGAYGNDAVDEAAWITLEALQLFDPSRSGEDKLKAFVCTKARQLYIDEVRRKNGRHPERRPGMIGIEDESIFAAPEEKQTTTIEEALHDKTPRRVRGAVIVSILLGSAAPAKVAKAMRCEAQVAAGLLAAARRRADD